MNLPNEKRLEMNKTLLVCIDGFRGDAIEKAHTPVLDYLIKKGASCLTVKTVTPSLTLPSHFSIFTSLAPYSHGVLTNTALPDISSLSQSLFAHIKQHGGMTSSFYSWEHLRNLALPGAMDYVFLNRLNREKDLIVLAGAATAHIVTRRPDFSFVYYEWLDIIGHRHGWMSKDYLTALELTDQALGLMLDGIDLFSDENSFNLVVISDHGGKERHHLDDSPEVTNVPFIACGRHIREGYRIKDEICLLDMAPTVAQLLGIPPHFAWEGKPVSEMMKSIPRQQPLTKVA